MKSYQIYQTKVEKFGFINYVYFIIDKRTRKAAIVDPSWDYEKISQTARNMGIEVVAVLLTHLHIDHSFSAKKYVDNNPDCKIYLSKNEYEYYKYSGKGIVTLSHFEQIIIGDTAIRCLVTPGHTKGSACYWLEDAIFTGDTIFAEGCGICNTEGGSAVEMYYSIQMIKRLIPPSVKLYAAHSYGKGQGKSMEEISKINIYFQIENLDTFVGFRNRTGQKNLFGFK